MRGYCATCGKIVEGRMLCPQCGVKLAHEPGTFAEATPEPDDPPDGPPFVRRLALGGITLLGLYNGLKPLALAGMLAHTSAATLPPGALVCLLVVATLAAAVVAGTVNRRAEVAGLILAGAGVVIGVLGALVMSRFLAGLLFEVTPFDTVTFAATCASLTLVALAAAWIPARRATRVEPTTALRAT